MLQRRQFITALAAVPSQLSAAGRPAEIIDTHIHLYDPSRPAGVPWPPKSDRVLYKPHLSPDFRSAVQGLGVTGAIIVEASPWLEDNQWILDLGRTDPMIVGVVGHLDPGSADFAAALDRFSGNPLFRGIRLSANSIAAGLKSAAYISGLERLSMANLMLDAIGGPVLFPTVLDLNDRVPSLRIILDHLPIYDLDSNAMAAFAALRDRKNIWAKVSGVLRNQNGRVPDDWTFYRDALDELWQIFGRDRLVYGSNWPVSNKVAPYRTVLNVVMSYFLSRGPDAAEAYFWRNSQAVYGWKRVG